MMKSEHALMALCFSSFISFLFFLCCLLVAQNHSFLFLFLSSYCCSSFYDNNIGAEKECVGPFKQAIRIITSKRFFFFFGTDKERDTQWKIILSLLWLIKSYFMFHVHVHKEMTVFWTLVMPFLLLRWDADDVYHHMYAYVYSGVHTKKYWRNFCWQSNKKKVWEGWRKKLGMRIYGARKRLKWC